MSPFYCILQVSIEYGLCEMLSREAIRLDVAPKDGIFYFDVPQLEALLPSGTLDNTVERVYKEVVYAVCLIYFLNNLRFVSL